MWQVHLIRQKSSAAHFGFKAEEVAAHSVGGWVQPSSRYSWVWMRLVKPGMSYRQRVCRDHETVLKKWIPWQSIALTSLLQQQQHQSSLATNLLQRLWDVLMPWFTCFVLCVAWIERVASHCVIIHLELQALSKRWKLRFMWMSNMNQIH